jgi:hypothetical protein
MIEQAWEREDRGDRGLYALWSRLKRASGSIQSWNRVNFGSVQREIKHLKELLRAAKERSVGGGHSQEVQAIERELHEMFEREEILYKQRSWVEWLNAGDRNTRYFQNRASHRRRKNTVRVLKNDDGSRVTTDEEMRALAQTFFMRLYQSEGANDGCYS